MLYCKHTGNNIFFQFLFMSLDERIKYASMKARHEKKLRPWYKKIWGKVLLVIIFIAGIVLVISGFYIVSEVKKIKSGESARYLFEQKENYLAAINRQSANTYGPASAPITIIEFSDFACPFCRDSYAGLKNIREKYPQEVKIVYRDYPLHETSILLSLAARCAGEQGNFWQMHDLFFENQENLNVSEDELKAILPEIASALNLNITSFNSCLDSTRHFAQIEQDYNDGSFLQLQGTPTWFINNQQIVGHISAQDLEVLVTGLINLKK